MRRSGLGRGPAATGFHERPIGMDLSALMQTGFGRGPGGLGLAQRTSGPEQFLVGRPNAPVEILFLLDSNTPTLKIQNLKLLKSKTFQTLQAGR
jgi:hypothetical protein